jgi:hypothetical protein
MEIICDTNIWYAIGNSFVLKDDNKLVVTFNSIDEFSRTEKLLDKPDHTMRAVQKMFKYSRNHAIFPPPLYYLLWLGDNNFSYQLNTRDLNILGFTELIARGHEVKPDKQDIYRQFCQERKAELKTAASLFSEFVHEINENAKAKKIPFTLESKEGIRLLISKFVQGETGKTLPVNFNWSHIDLFESVFHVFYDKLEKGSMTMTSNDWYDLLLLVYVQPDRKVWTNEGKWIDIIKSIGRENYLYSPE